MKAAKFTKIGDPTTDDVLSVVESEVPTPKKGEILVKVAAASVNPVDWKLIQGALPGVKPGSVGFDVSGTVEAIGPDCGDLSIQVGDAVYADTYPIAGSWAEYCLVKAPAAALKPSNIDFEQAASLPLCALTALQSLRNGGFEAGKTIAVLGGSTGVGSLAIQMAKDMGAAHIYSTGTSKELIEGFGADTVINYRTESAMDELQGKELDVVLDCVGGIENWKIAKSALKRKGIFVTIVGDNSGMFSTIAALIGRSALSLFGFTKYSFTMTSTSAPGIAKDMKTITDLVEAGKLKPVLDGRTFQLTTNSIHEMVEASISHRAKGKLILKMK